jgi:hypothetical protein
VFHVMVCLFGEGSPHFPPERMPSTDRVTRSDKISHNLIARYQAKSRRKLASRASEQEVNFFIITLIPPTTTQPFSNPTKNEHRRNADRL